MRVAGMAQAADIGWKLILNDRYSARRLRALDPKRKLVGRKAAVQRLQQGRDVKSVPCLHY